MKLQIGKAQGGTYPLRLILICLLIWITTLHFDILATNFKLKPLRSGFYGSVVLDSTIIVYGDYGVILKSTNKGKDWELETLGEQHKLHRIISYKDTLWGISEKSCILLSTDKGESWILKKIDTAVNDNFFWFLMDDEFLYVRGLSSIYKINRKFEIIKIFTDPRITIQFYNFHYTNELTPNLLSPLLRQMYFAYDKIVVLVNYTHNGFWLISKDLDSLRFVSIEDKIKLQKDEQGLNLFQILDYQKKPAFQFSPRFGLFFTDEEFTNWKWFTEDSTFLNFTTDDKSLRYANEVRITPWSNFTLNFELFGTKSLIVFKDSIPIYTNHIFKKYSPTPKDTIMQIGKPLRNNYFTTIVFSSLGFSYNYDCISLALSYPNVSGDTNFAVFTTNSPTRPPFDQNKLVILSENNFSDFKLISVLHGKPLFILNDSTYFFVNEREIYRTFNGGVSFLPLEYYKEGDSEPKLPGQTMLILREITQIFVDSSGFGVLLGLPSNSVPTKTYDFFKTIDYKADIPGNSSINLFDFIPINIVFKNNKFLLGFYSTSGTPFRFSFYLGDSSFTNFRQINFDSLYAPLFIAPITLNHFYSFGFANKDSDIVFEIRESKDTGRTLTKILTLEQKFNIIQFHQLNLDTVFFSTSKPDRVYLYDIPRNELKLIWQAEEEDFRPMLMVISDRFYIVGRGLFLENTDRSDLTKWREGKWDYGKPNFESVIFKGNVAIAGLSDSLRPFNYYKITLKKNTTTNVESSQIASRSYTIHFYATEPYPLPAHNIVKSKLYWDGSFNLNQAIDGVYDVMGNKVEGKQRITIKELGKATAELTWNCSGVPSGIYFIVVRHNGRVDTIPVIVE